MRLSRLAFILLAIYFVFIGGSAYYDLIFPIRLFHHLLVTILLAVWLIGRIRRGAGFPKTPLNLPILGAVIVWIVTAAASIDPRMAFENLWFPLTHVVLFFVLVDLFQRRRGRLVMETTFMIGALVMVVTGLELASWYFGLGIIPNTQIGWISVIGPGAWLPLEPLRVSLAMNISTLLAGFVAPLVILAGAWALSARRNYRVVLWLLAGGLLLVLILTFSRGGLLSILTAVGLFGFLRLLQMPRVDRRFPVRALAGVLVFIGVAAVSFYTILSITQTRSVNTGDVGRLDMWQSAAEMTGDRLLTGVGPGLFGRAFRTYRDPTIAQDKLASAHNAYLNTTAETGLPGIVVSLWLAATFGLAWYRNWRTEKSAGQKLRLEAALAALLGLAVHSLVDVFTITPIVLLILVLVAYCVTGRENGAGSIHIEKRRYRIIAPIVALFITIGYGVWLFHLDRAQSRYMNSFGDADNALTNAQEAVDLDPSLNLYPLQVTFLTGQEALRSTNPDWEQAAQSYEHSLELEPTWDTGWINLAAIKLRQGDNQAALDYLDHARQIKVTNLASLQWAVLAEKMNAASENTIIDAYLTAIKSTVVLPLSDFWWATDLRRAAIEQFLTDSPIDEQYRILAVHDPERARTLVSPTPSTAAEWWVAGEYALSAKNDREQAISDFSEAIQHAVTNGDYYASRARAERESDPEAAQRDLNIATLLGTLSEYPNAIRAEMAATPDEANQLRANALPPKGVREEFAAVLYGRPAQFDVFPEMRGVGPGRTVMQPWYAIADFRVANGDMEGAVRAYRAILDYAPDEQEAQEKLDQLTAGGI